MKFYIGLFSLALVLASCNQNKSNNEENKSHIEKTVAEKIADRYGIAKFNEVEELQFTFNVDNKGSHRSRQYSWFPKTGDVTFMSAQDTISFNRDKDMDSLTINADKAFINDTYWLLAPFKLVWDEGTSISTPEKTKAPLSGNLLNKITITYTGNGGYTPGDAYDFYFDDKYLIKEWSFRRGNQSEPSLNTTWENEESFDGLVLVKDRIVPGDDWKLYFTDLNVKFSK
ncbi:hypothetical protein [Aegicerativicinus sediminis]|uniref:hypothetical protein n=1 Tax=Aegicerativicinus sediminis TaxID=2893202 RepID=UPI001E38D6EE|nr:hypothetical protein [Aegicerativicinus sediminis]